MNEDTPKAGARGARQALKGAVTLSHKQSPLPASYTRESSHVDGGTKQSIIQRWMWRRTKPASSTVTSRLHSSSLIVDVPGLQGAVLSAKASVGAAWARAAGYAVTSATRAPARAWRRPRKKRRCRWPPCGHCTRMGRRALWRASELRCGGHQSFRERTSRTTTSTSLNCRVEHLDLGVSNRTVRREELAVNTRLFNSKG
jgi:hypothetical protein